jgi:branched-chain amino acid transport system ATP-binding protein
MSAVLEVSNIKKSFGGITAVDGVSFDVREGEILGLIGPNGCGKSTLFNCILGQLTPSGGEVKLDGKVVTGLRPPSSTSSASAAPSSSCRYFQSFRCART